MIRDRVKDGPVDELLPLAGWVPESYSEVRQNRACRAGPLSRCQARSAGARHLIWDRVKDGPVDELLPLASEQKDFRNQGVRKEEALCTGSVDDRRHRWEQACLLGFEQDV